MLSNTCCRRFQRFRNDDFHVEDRLSGERDKIFENAELEALLNTDSCQSQEVLARSLEVTQQVSSKRLKDLGMIQKQRNWVRYELKSSLLNGVCLLVNSCSKGKDGRDFCVALWLWTKNEFSTITPRTENYGDVSAMLPRRRPNPIFPAPRWCRVLGRIRWTFLYYQLWSKQSQAIVIERN